MQMRIASRSTSRATLAAKQPHLRRLHTFNYSDVVRHAATGANIILPPFYFRQTAP